MKLPIVCCVLKDIEIKGVFMKKQILLDNAFESWLQAIKEANAISGGLSTLGYQKRFISSLHNAIELFLKQVMLDDNDHRVAETKKIDKQGHPMLCFLQQTDLNLYFETATVEDLKKFKTIQFSELITIIKPNDSLLNNFFSNDNIIKKDFISALERLNQLRNQETHFYISAHSYLSESDFVQFYNMMIDFAEFFKTYRFLNVGMTGKLLPRGPEESRLIFYPERDFLSSSFSYKKALLNNRIFHEIKEKFDNSLVFYEHSNVYELSDYLFYTTNLSSPDLNLEGVAPFEEVFTIMELAVYYELITSTPEIGEYPYEPENELFGGEYLEGYLLKFLC